MTYQKHHTSQNQNQLYSCNHINHTTNAPTTVNITLLTTNVKPLQQNQHHTTPLPTNVYTTTKTSTHYSYHHTHTHTHEVSSTHSYVRILPPRALITSWLCGGRGEYHSQYTRPMYYTVNHGYHKLPAHRSPRTVTDVELSTSAYYWQNWICRK